MTFGTATPYGYNFKAEGDGSYGFGTLLGASDSFWNRPTNYDQWQNPVFGVESLGGISSTSSPGNTFGNLLSSFKPQTAGGALSSFNPAEMMAGMAGIRAAADSRGRQLGVAMNDAGYERDQFINANRWLGNEGTHLTQARDNIFSRSEVERNAMERAREDQSLSRALRPVNFGLNQLLPSTRLV